MEGQTSGTKRDKKTDYAVQKILERQLYAQKKRAMNRLKESINKYRSA